jgi:hypothetical protein
MYLPPVGIIQNIESNGEPSTKRGQKIAKEKGEKKEVLPSQPPTEVEPSDPRAEEKQETEPYECVPKNLSFQ